MPVTAPFSFTQSSATRAIGTTGWQLSTSQSGYVSYSVSINVAVTILAGAAGYVALQVATDSAFTTPQELGRTGNSGSGLIGLNSTNSGQISGFVPLGYYVRLLSVNTTGTPTYAYLAGQEVLFN